jgi:hypothetical protein
MGKNRNKDAYSLLRYKDTNEIHIFKGHFTEKSCTAQYSSICKKVTDWRNEEIENVKTCLDEDETRHIAADIGRDVCGICVSHLYSNYGE